MEDGSNTPLSNEDFKRLMMTPRAHEETPVPDYLTRKKKRREGQRIDTDELFARPKEKDDEDRRRRIRDDMYRDRAAERRKGGNPDYIEDSKMLKEAGLPTPKMSETPIAEFTTPITRISASSITPSYNAKLLSSTPLSSNITRMSYAPINNDPVTELLPDSVQHERNREIREIIEKSKYLGGDVKHTHLVKGLDFALLNKVRQEIQQSTKEMEEEEKKRKKQEEEARRREEQIKGKQFQSSVGKAVWDFLFVEKTKQCDTFLPGRTCFRFEFDDIDAAPNTLRRPKHEIDLSRDNRKNAGLTNPSLLRQILKICIEKRKGIYGNIKDRKKREREKEKEKLLKDKAKEKEKEKKKVAEEDRKKLEDALNKTDRGIKAQISLLTEDIFPDAGEYIPEGKSGPIKPKLHPNQPLFKELQIIRSKEIKEAQRVEEVQKSRTNTYQKQSKSSKEDEPKKTDKDRKDVGFSKSSDIVETQQLTSEQQSYLQSQLNQYYDGSSKSKDKLSNQEKAQGLATIFRRDPVSALPPKKDKNRDEYDYVECYPETNPFSNADIDEDDEDNEYKSRKKHKSDPKDKKDGDRQSKRVTSHSHKSDKKPHKRAKKHKGGSDSD